MGDMVECEQNERMTVLMSLSLDGLLDIEGQRQLKQHLAACPTCRAEWKAMQQLATLFEQEPMVGPPLGFAIRVDRRLAEQARKRRRLFGGAAVLTSSLSLAGVTVTAVMVIVLGLVAWQWFGSFPTVELGTSALSQVASGLGLVGKGARLFLGDLLLRYGPPLILAIAIGLAVLVGLWIWLFVKRPGSHENGYV